MTKEYQDSLWEANNQLFSLPSENASYEDLPTVYAKHWKLYMLHGIPLPNSVN
jgi:hypothetical protein